MRESIFCSSPESTSAKETTHDDWLDSAQRPAQPGSTRPAGRRLHDETGKLVGCREITREPGRLLRTLTSVRRRDRSAASPSSPPSRRLTAACTAAGFRAARRAAWPAGHQAARPAAAWRRACRTGRRGSAAR
eukprot:scaffold84090_cov66-Phaeocystis_antarctica.AAC.1